MDANKVAELWEGNAEAWTRLARKGHDIYRDALNTPAFLGMLPPVRGLSGLDIGCGEGTNTRRLAELGARMTAVDIAPTFVRHARETERENPLGIDYQLGDAMALPFADRTFDFATAFMSLMDVPDIPAALREAFRVLKPGGFLQFSILHPCFVPPHRRTLRNQDGDAYAVELAGYFDSIDGRVDTWVFGSASAQDKAGLAPFNVPRFHRTLSAWVAMLVGAGFVIQEFGEPSASPEVARAVPVVADTRVVGIFLHVRVGRPAA